MGKGPPLDIFTSVPLLVVIYINPFWGESDN